MERPGLSGPRRMDSACRVRLGASGPDVNPRLLLEQLDRTVGHRQNHAVPEEGDEALVLRVASAFQATGSRALTLFSVTDTLRAWNAMDSYGHVAFTAMTIFEGEHIRAYLRVYPADARTTTKENTFPLFSTVLKGQLFKKILLVENFAGFSEPLFRQKFGEAEPTLLEKQRLRLANKHCQNPHDRCVYVGPGSLTTVEAVADTLELRVQYRRASPGGSAREPTWSSEPCFYWTETVDPRSVGGSGFVARSGSAAALRGVGMPTGGGVISDPPKRMAFLRFLTAELNGLTLAPPLILSPEHLFRSQLEESVSKLADRYITGRPQAGFGNPC